MWSTDRPMDRPTGRPTSAKQYTPRFFEGGHNNDHQDSDGNDNDNDEYHKVHNNTQITD